MNAFPIGISALNVGRRAIDLIGQNIANATTPGYHRQALNLVSRTLGGPTGVGVDVASVTRYDAPVVRTALLRGNGELEFATTRLAVRRQVETAVGAGKTGIDGGLEDLFDQIEKLTARPDDVSVRRPVIGAAADLAGRLNAAAGDLDRARYDLRGQVTGTVAEVNDFAKRIADLNVRISGIEGAGGQANDLRDQRDGFVNELSKRMNVKAVPQENGIVNVIADGAAVVVGEFANTFTATIGASGNLTITQAGSTQPVPITGGRLGAQLAEHNTELPATRGRLDTLARELVRRMNAVQATGVAASGPLTLTRGTQSVADPTQPLATQNLPIPITAGNLVVGVTNSATGARTHHSIAIDPNTQSLQDVAAAVTAATGGRVTGSIDPTNNTLRFDAQSGFAFDFAGRVPNPPNAVAMGGTSTPTVGGVYTGAANDVYNFQVSGSGTVGVTAGLSMEVRDAANAVVATVNVGAGYTPGTPIVVGNGITVTLGAGTTANGSFSAPMTANADTAGVLPGLGVNGLFSGSDATGIAVRPELVADPRLLSGSRSGQPGDATNFERLAGLRDVAVIGGRTFGREAADQASAVGLDVQSLGDQESALGGLVLSLEGQEQSVSGVDINEEMVHLLDFQRMVEGASKYLSAVNTALDSILEIVR